jgi:hypothetical protein
MRKPLLLLAPFLSIALIALTTSILEGCSKSEASGNKSVEYGDAVGIEFGDATSGRFLAAVAAEKGHSPEKGVSALATALQQASKGCPDLAKEAVDAKRPPTLHLLVKSGALEAEPGDPSDGPSVACMAKAINGKPAGLDAPTPFGLTIQLLAKKAGE